MIIKGKFEMHQETLVVFPTLSIHDLRCGECDASHGLAFDFGWLFWTAGVGFFNPPTDHEGTPND